MPIDRRITNGLAWAGALLVVAVPAADIAIRQVGLSAAPQVAVVTPEAVSTAGGAPTPSLPTPVADRPKPATPADKPVAPEAEPVAEQAPAPAVENKPVATAVAPASGSVVNDFLQSGRPLPSYITGAGSTPGSSTASVETSPAPKPAPATPATPAPEQVASVAPGAVVGFPTPVSLRPAGLPQAPVGTQPPLIIDTAPGVTTAEDLEDWESGPLSEFLASRQNRQTNVSSDYDPDGFFLDEGPNSNVTVRRFPNAYEPFYPFE